MRTSFVAFFPLPSRIALATSLSLCALLAACSNDDADIGRDRSPQNQAGTGGTPGASGASGTAGKSPGEAGGGSGTGTGTGTAGTATAGTTGTAGTTAGAAGHGSPEICDGLDNDLNGLIDDNATCANGGICQSGDCVVAGQGGSSPGKTEICDGIDNDGNGLIDDNAFCANGGVCQSGDCVVAGGQGGSSPGNKEICDGIDNDGNGLIDDNATCPGNELCQNGICAASPCSAETSSILQELTVPETRDCSQDTDCVTWYGSCVLPEEPNCSAAYPVAHSATAGLTAKDATLASCRAASGYPCGTCTESFPDAVCTAGKCSFPAN